MSDDPFLQQKVDALCDTPMQRKLRALRPLPVGVVVWQRVGDTIDDLRHEFRAVHGLGFIALKQMALHGDTPISARDAEMGALDEGLVPWHYGAGGWKPITPELLAQLEIDPDLPLAAIQADPRMIAFQTAYLAERSRRLDAKPAPPSGVSMGEPGRNGASIPDELIPAFAAWLRATYGSFEAALATYHLAADQVKGPFPGSLDELAALASAGRVGDQRGQGWAGFRQKRDILRFQADHMCAQIRQVAAMSQAWDADEPIRTGIHRALENQAANGWDFELQARAVAEAGSFYASFHPTHHLLEADGEMERPCYMTARIVADSNKGGWTAMWESVGGPQTYSGHYSYTFDGRAMERCILSYLAAGLKGVGIWSWNARDKGWEIGEYSLCDLTGKPSDRAVTAGAIASACQRQRFELWEARDQPRVGLLYSWENEAAFARLSYGGYPLDRLAEFPQYPAYARIGAMRALIDGCVPWELVTERNLAEGLAARYGTIYVPHTICLSSATVRVLRDYVEAGGRLVVDSPSLLVRADDGTLFDTRAGSDFEHIFGLEIAANQSTFNYPLRFLDRRLTGFWTDVNVTTAEITHTFDDGHPAVLQHRLGRGSAVFLTFEASSMMHRPGNTALQRFVVDLLLDGEPPPYAVDRPILAYRRVAPTADHFFLINDGPARHDTELSVRAQAYRAAEDCVTGERVPVEGGTLHVTLAPWQGRWIRMEHANDEPAAV